MNHTQNSQTRRADFVLVRISDSNATKELEKKVVETARMHPMIPGASTLRRLGAGPLSDPSSVGGDLYSGPGFRAVSFRIPGTRTQVLLVLGSATKVNVGEDDNAFVNLLSDLLTQSPVDSLWVADFARLLRSIDFLSATWKAVRTSCGYVRHAGAVIDTANPTAEIQFLFEALSAAAEARAVVKRTTIGKMRACLSGRCSLAKGSVPLGYTKDEDGRLILAPSVPRAVVRKIVQVLGDPSLSNRERVREVAELGAVSEVGSRQRGRVVGVDELDNPANTVGRWYALLDVWSTGSWRVDVQLPMLLLTTRFDLPVEIYDRDGLRYWVMRFDLELPEGGWATSDEFDAAFEQREQRGRHLVGGSRRLLAGRGSWFHGKHQYTLLSSGSGLYQLRRRLKEAAQVSRVIDGKRIKVDQGWGRAPNLRGQLVCKLDGAQLQRVIAEGLVEEARRGLRLASASRAVLESHADVSDELRAQLKELRRVARNAQRNANEADTEADRKAYLARHREASGEVARIEADLLRFVGSGGTSGMPVNLDEVVAALVKLADTTGPVAAEVANAVDQIICDIRLFPGSGDKLRWEACLRVPVAQGSLVLGPATGTVEVGHSRALAAKRTASLADRAEEATRLFMGDGLTIAETAERLEISTIRRVAQTIRDHLKQQHTLSSAAASLLVADGVPAARAAVWSQLTTGRPPKHLSPAYAVHTAEIYRDPSVQAGKHVPSTLQRQSAIDYVTNAGGWVPEKDLEKMRKAIGIGPRTFETYLRGSDKVPMLLRLIDGGVSHIACPHDICSGYATLYLPHPEVTRSLLCDVCRRMPVPDSCIVFPSDYR